MFASKGATHAEGGQGRGRRRTPFTIKLTIATGETKQDVTLGVDAGARHVGISATTEKEEVFASEVALRQDITGLLADRLAFRRARRNRKTRYRAPRFNNRVRSKHKGWLAPSVENRIQAHMSRIDAVCRLLPVTKIVIETASFDIQKIRNPEVEGTGLSRATSLDSGTCASMFFSETVISVSTVEADPRIRSSTCIILRVVKRAEMRQTTYHAVRDMPQGLSRRKDQVEGQARSFAQGGSLHGHHALDIVEPHAQGASQSACREHLRLSDEAQAHCSWLAKDALRRRLLHCGKSESVAKRRFPLPTTDAKAQPTDTQVFDSQGWSEELNQAPFLVKGFRLFDKVRIGGQIGFVFGRRVRGIFKSSP